jgi:RNA polymerase sigma-70 factor, ECF subfamily
VLDRALALADGPAACNARRIRAKSNRPIATCADAALIAALRRRDRDLVFEVVERWSDAMVRLALVYVRGRPVAEEVVQETWIGVLEGIDRFEGRSSLRTWVFSILVNQAKMRGERERRSLPFSALGAEGSVDPTTSCPPTTRGLGTGRPRPDPCRRRSSCWRRSCAG